MSVIAWDGTTLAADKRASCGGFFHTTRKILRANGCLLGFTGGTDFGEQMVNWWIRGANADDFPPSQRDKDDWAGLLVVMPDGTLFKYERTPYPITIQERMHALGSGRDFAMAAMFCGRTAAEAVGIACRFDSGCGNGVDTLTLREA